MKLTLDKVVFALVLALWAVVILILLAPETANTSGTAHPTYETLRVGGDASRHGGVLALGWAFGTLIIGVFVALMAFGAQQAGRERGATLPLFATGAAVVGLWTWLVLAYRSGAGQTDPDLFLAFPPAAAILIYALWPVPAFFAVLFVVGFKRWVLSDEDHEAFEKMLPPREPR